MGISIRSYAKHKKVSEGAVRKAIKSGRVIPESDGTIDQAKADASWKRNTNQAQQRKQPPTPPKVQQQPTRPAVVQQPTRPIVQKPSPPKVVGPDFQTSRAVKETYAAKMAMLDFEERTKGLVNADEVRVSAFNLGRRVRDRLLLIPHRIAAILAAEMDADKVEKLLADELRKAMEELTS
jgi:hypothetical protein